MGIRSSTDSPLSTLRPHSSSSSAYASSTSLGVGQFSGGTTAGGRSPVKTQRNGGGPPIGSISYRKRPKKGGAVNASKPLMIALHQARLIRNLSASCASSDAPESSS